MPINWDEIDFDDILDDAEKKTDDALASKISSLTKMTDEEVHELFPKAGDVQKFTHLMQIVKSAEDRNTKITKIVSNAEEFGGVLVTLLGKVV